MMIAPLLEDMKFYIVVPAAATNLVTNPTPYKVTTGYTAVLGSIALTDAQSRRGPGCIEVTPTTGASGIYFGNVSITSGTAYTFSVDVLGEAGKAMRIKVEDAGGSYTYTTTFTATGYWQRIKVTFTAQETASDYRLYVIRDATTGTNVFYVDGFQFEAGSEATTFFSGDTQGLGFAPLEFYWGGTPHGSVSYRTADTRAGGRLLDIETYAVVSAGFGLGMGNYKQAYTDLVSGGAMYQRHIRKPRNISFKLMYYGANAGELHDNRNAIIEAIRPDYTGFDQPLVIRYQGLNASGYEATNPVDIVCIPQPSHANIPDNSRLQNDVLSFTVLDGYLMGAYKEGAELEFATELDDTNNLVVRLATGEWTDVFGIVGTNVVALAEAPNGDIIIGGTFTNAGGDPDADYLCKWDGSAISAVAAGINAYVAAICFDAAGNMYLGGLFYNVGDANGDGIVKWDGTSFTSLGTGAYSIGGPTVSAIAIDPATGDVYAGGSFTQMGGVANTSGVARWNGTTWNALATGLNGEVHGLAFSPGGDLYLCGNFTNADGINGDYICRWDGTAFHMLGDTELVAPAGSRVVWAIDFDKQGNLYAAGGFEGAGGDSNANKVAVFKNNSWHALGAGLVGGMAYRILVTDDKVYVSGMFTHAGGLSLSDRLAIWSNGAWQLPDVDLVGWGALSALLETGSKQLWVGGAMTGTSVSAGSNQLINASNSNVYPTVVITGPGILLSLTNYTTGKSIQFDGLTLQAGETITIKLDPTNLSMTSSWPGRGNVTRYLNAGSNLGDFYLKPGTNHVSFYMPSGTSANTKAYIYWTPAFWNIEGSRYE